MTEENSSVGSSVKKLIFACSGAADVGDIADRAARELSREGRGKMFCLAGVGGRIPNMVKTTEQADAVLAIDGCTQNCASQCLQSVGIAEFRHLRLAELGFEKGMSPVTEAAIARVSDEGKRLLG
jgi:uncharacterized metal-binding protein